MTANLQQLATRRKKRRLAFGLAINGFVLGALLVGGELYARSRFSHVTQVRDDSVRGAASVDSPAQLVTRTAKGKRLVKNAHVVIANHWISKRDIRMDINSLGFRDDELPATKRQGELRILVLGDSITCGDYLPAEDVWVEQVETQLRAARPAAPVEVINAGVGDIGLREELDILDDPGLSTAPDVVLLAFYLNDSRPPWGFPGELGAPGFVRRNSVLAQALHREFVLQNWIEETGDTRLPKPSTLRALDWTRDRAQFAELVRLCRFDWGAAWENSSWTIVDAQLDRLAARAEERGFKVAVVIFPVAFQVLTEFVDDRPQWQMKALAAKRGWPCLDLLPACRANRTADMFYDQCHPTPPTNTLMAREVTRFLETQVLGH